MGARKFDLRLGRDVFATIPAAPGVYRFYDAAGVVVYVGKAKNLRRRLAQYRKARRLKAHAKMRAIVAVSARLEWAVAADDLEACRAELAAIQAERPRLNVAGAYSHLYPLIFLAPGEGWIGLTTQEDAFRPAWEKTTAAAAESRVHGTFRSRRRARDFFASLLFLLERIGHVRAEQPTRELRYSRIARVRQAPGALLAELDAWLGGHDPAEFLPALVLALTESAYARAHPREIQEHLAELARFHREEIAPLARARRELAYAAYPVPRAERDRLFLEARARERA